MPSRSTGDDDPVNVEKKLTTQITTSTFVNVGLVMVMLGSVVTLVRWSSGLEAKMEQYNRESIHRMEQYSRESGHRMELITAQIEDVREDVILNTGERWRRTEMKSYDAALKAWIDLFRAENQNSISVPRWPDVIP